MMGAQEAQGSTLEVCGEVLLIVEIELKREGLLLRLLLLFITAKQNHTGSSYYEIGFSIRGKE